MEYFVPKPSTGIEYVKWSRSSQHKIFRKGIVSISLHCYNKHHPANTLFGYVFITEIKEDGLRFDVSGNYNFDGVGVGMVFETEQEAVDYVERVVGNKLEIRIREENAILEEKIKENRQLLQAGCD